MTSFMEKGMLPLPGALLDQTQIFLEASRFIGAERARQKAEIMEKM